MKGKEESRLQLTGPVFLFLFLPLSLPLSLLFPKGRQGLFLSLLSLLWYGLAYHGNLPACLHIAGLLLFAALIVFFPGKRGKTRTVIGVILPLASLLTARVLDFCLPAYTYPMGLGFLTLALISLVLDLSHGGAEPPRNPFDLIAYLLLFPTLAVGPVIRYRHFEAMLKRSTRSMRLFSDGVLFYTQGFVKRLAVAAVFTRSFQRLLEEVNASFLFLLSALLFSLIIFFFFLSGTADMARGVCAMYGLSLPRDRQSILLATAPHTMLFGILFSLYRYFDDYLATPLRRLGGKRGVILAELSVWLCFLLFIGIHPLLLVVALPALVCAIVCGLRGQAGRSHPMPLRVLFFLLSSMATAAVTLALLLGSPARVLSTLRGMSHAAHLPLYQFFLALPDAQYLLYALAVIAALSLYRLLSVRLALLRSLRQHPGALLARSLLLLLAFVLTALYFMPQFPEYAGSLAGSIGL